MKKIVMALFAFFLFFNAAQAVSSTGEAIWVDVRTVGEYQRGHKVDAINIPHTIIGHRIAELTTDKDAEIHLYCAAGVRAGIAKRRLEKMGYTNVINEGGLSDVQ